MKICFNLIIVGYLAFAALYAQTTETLLFIGSYTNHKPGSGIYVYSFNDSNGKLSRTQVVEGIVNPSFLKIGPSGRYLYAVTNSQMEEQGQVAAFKVDAEHGKLAPINTQSSGGRNPVHLEIGPQGKTLICSNYTDPSASLFSIRADGGLEPYHQILRFKGSSIIPGRQETAHMHSTIVTPDHKYLLAMDLGADLLRKFSLGVKDQHLGLTDEEGIPVPAGSGPRHFAFSPKGNYGYCVAELSGKILAYAFQAGKMEYIEQYSLYGTSQESHRSADIHISPDGKFLYASNRGPAEDSIVVFAIDDQTGKLKFVQRQDTLGAHPRNLVISPSGNFVLVANQFSNSVVVFKRDRLTGKLKQTQQQLHIASPSTLQMFTYNR